MCALHPLPGECPRLLKLGRIPAIAFMAAARNEDRARDPVVGQNTSLHLFIQNIRSGAESHSFVDLDTASAKELDRLFNARISCPLSGKS
jgi:hypothetical protein